jgi:hypothetical protein
MSTAVKVIFSVTKNGLADHCSPLTWLFSPVSFLLDGVVPKIHGSVTRCFNACIAQFRTRHAEQAVFSRMTLWLSVLRVCIAHVDAINVEHG